MVMGCSWRRLVIAKRAGWISFALLVGLAWTVLVLLCVFDYRRRSAGGTPAEFSWIWTVAVASYLLVSTVFARLGAGLVERLFTRALCGRPVGAPPAGDGRDGPLFFVTCLTTASPAWGFAMGYRLFQGSFVATNMLIFFVVLALLPGAVWNLIRPRNRGWRRRGRAAARLLVVLSALPGAIVLLPAAEFGRKRLEAEIGVERLARDCERVWSETSHAKKFGWVKTPDFAASTIGRLKPRRIDVRTTSLRLVFHGGFDHYGYELNMDLNEKTWTFGYYSAGGVEDLLVWPADVSGVEVLDLEELKARRGVDEPSPSAHEP